MRSPAQLLELNNEYHANLVPWKEGGGGGGGGEKGEGYKV